MRINEARGDDALLTVDDGCAFVGLRGLLGWENSRDAAVSHDDRRLLVDLVVIGCDDLLGVREKADAGHDFISPRSREERDEFVAHQPLRGHS